MLRKAASCVIVGILCVGSVSVSYGCSQKYIDLTHNEDGILFTYLHNCYEIVPSEQTWTAAESDCRTRGGHLVHIVSQAEQDAIFHIVKKFHGDHVWIGLHDRDDEEQFVWTSGDALTYTDWYPGRKAWLIHNSQDCVALRIDERHDGRWEDVACAEHHGYICEFDAVTISHEVTSPPPVNIYSDGNLDLCPNVGNSGTHQNTVYAQFDHSCYELLSHKASWSQGELLCKDVGGHLVHIETALEQEYIQTLLERHDTEEAVWIGLNDHDEEGQFEWTSGEAVTFTNWVPGHVGSTSSSNHDDCVVLLPSQSGEWEAVRCNRIDFLVLDKERLHYPLCEYDTVIADGATVLIG